MRQVGNGQSFRGTTGPAGVLGGQWPPLTGLIGLSGVSTAVCRRAATLSGAPHAVRPLRARLAT